jgi:hypothetical protein
MQYKRQRKFLANLPSMSFRAERGTPQSQLTSHKTDKASEHRGHGAIFPDIHNLRDFERSLASLGMTLLFIEKIRDCIRIAALLRERVLRLAFDCKRPRDVEFTLK